MARRFDPAEAEPTDKPGLLPARAGPSAHSLSQWARHP